VKEKGPANRASKAQSKKQEGKSILQLGHAKPSITFDVYSHLLKKHRPTAAEQTDARLFATAKEHCPPS
jgi:hypothetical protein